MAISIPTRGHGFLTLRFMPYSCPLRTPRQHAWRANAEVFQVRINELLPHPWTRMVR